jgi:hypothetical protein
MRPQVHGNISYSIKDLSFPQRLLIKIFAIVFNYSVRLRLQLDIEFKMIKNKIG